MIAKTIASTAIAAAIAASTFATATSSANASMFRDNGMTLVWVTIKSHRGEGLWQACRRVYQRDVYQVRHGHDGRVRCNIDHSRLYDYGERHQNFNN